MPRPCPRNTFEYVIKRNDTLDRIARRFNVTVRQILAVNPDLNFYSRLRVGTIICIPRRGAQVPPCPPRNRYRVRPGDTLNTIARDFDVTVGELLRANPGLQPRRLYVGMIICIPARRPIPPGPGPGPRPGPCPHASVPYVINPGDTLGNIANRYSTTVADILRINPDLDPNMIRVGQRICIPGVGTLE